MRLGYYEDNIQDILDELDALFSEIDFYAICSSSYLAMDQQNETRLISLLQDVMVRLEKKGFYRPDFPTRLLKLLVNGLNRANEDIFAVLEKADIPEDGRHFAYDLVEYVYGSLSPGPGWKGYVHCPFLFEPGYPSA